MAASKRGSWERLNDDFKKAAGASDKFKGRARRESYAAVKAARYPILLLPFCGLLDTTGLVATLQLCGDPGMLTWKVDVLA